IGSCAPGAATSGSVAPAAGGCSTGRCSTGSGATARSSTGSGSAGATDSAGAAGSTGGLAFGAVRAGARLRAAADGLVRPLPRPGRPRVPRGMISASATVASGDRGAHVVDQQARGGGEAGRERLDEVGERLGGGEARPEAEHPGARR